MGNDEKTNQNNSLYNTNILIVGKMRQGKSSLIRLLTNKNPKIEPGVDPVTGKSSIYEGILDNIKFKCIDTPGLSESPDQDIIHLSELKKFLVDKKIKIKHIIITISFQEQSFSDEFQRILTTIITYFPMPYLWKHITLCYTFYYGQVCKSAEDILKEKYPSLKKNFDNIMGGFTHLNVNKIEYNEIKKVYVDIYFPDDSKEKKNCNAKSLKALKLHLKEIFNEKPMYSSIKLRIEDVEYAKISERNQEQAIIYKNRIEITEYYDINGFMIGKSYRIVGKEKIFEIKSKSFWKNLMGGGIASAILGGIVGLGAIALAFVPGGVAISGVALASIGISGGGVGLAGTGLAIGSSIRDNQLIDDIKKKESLKEEIDKNSIYE